MRFAVLQDLANAVCQMAVAGRMRDDYEFLATLPDGEIKIDLLAGVAEHSSGETVELKAPAELSAWLSSRLQGTKAQDSTLTSATVWVQYRTDRIKTVRQKIVSFDFSSRCTLATKDGAAEGVPAFRHAYHQRVDA